MTKRKVTFEEGVNEDEGGPDIKSRRFKDGEEGEEGEEIELEQEEEPIEEQEEEVHKEEGREQIKENNEEPQIENNENVEDVPVEATSDEITASTDETAVITTPIEEEVEEVEGVPVASEEATEEEIEPSKSEDDGGIIDPEEEAAIVEAAVKATVEETPVTKPKPKRSSTRKVSRRKAPAKRAVVAPTPPASIPGPNVENLICGQWVEVVANPKQPSYFNCGECARKFNARESSMKHFHWCDPNAPLPKIRKKPTNSTGRRRAGKRIGEGEKPITSKVNDTLKDLIVNVTPEQVTNQESLRRGADSRKKYTNIEKLKIIDEVYSGEKPQDVASKYGINRSLISKWHASKDILIETCNQNDKKCFDTKNRRKVKYEKLYADLHQQFKAAEAAGVTISYRWIHDTAEKMFKEYFPDATSLPQSFVSNFTKRFELTYQKKYKKAGGSKTTTPSSAAVAAATAAIASMEEEKSPAVRWHSDTRTIPHGTHPEQTSAIRTNYVSPDVPLSFAAMNYLPQQLQHHQQQQQRHPFDPRHPHPLDQRHQQAVSGLAAVAAASAAHQQHVVVSQQHHHQQQQQQQHYRTATEPPILSEQMRLPSVYS